MLVSRKLTKFPGLLIKNLSSGYESVTTSQDLTISRILLPGLFIPHQERAAVSLVEER